MKFNRFRRRQREEEHDAEIRSHLDETIRDRIARGEARANTLREFGNVGLVKKVTCEMWGWAWNDGFIRRANAGLRQSVKERIEKSAAKLCVILGCGSEVCLHRQSSAFAFTFTLQ